MAKEKRPAAAPSPVVPAADWDDPYGPVIPDAPAGETLPPRAARLASQNGPAMRNCFAYLLDEEPRPLPPAAVPPPKKRR